MDELPPILEFDPTRQAVVEPSRVARPIGAPEHCVICFFREVIEDVASAHNARVIAEAGWEDGPHPLYEIEHAGRRLAFFHPGVGAPVAGGLLEEAIARGCRRFIACGGCGVLEPGVPVGQLIVVTAAVRDEGLSYHYLPAGREIEADPEAVRALEDALREQSVPFRRARTWTTDAPYRETRARVAARRRQGCRVVEMEASALMAVARFRGATFGQVLYAGDDLSGEAWDHRDWQSQPEVRSRLFWLAAEACLKL